MIGIGREDVEDAAAAIELARQFDDFAATDTVRQLIVGGRPDQDVPAARREGFAAVYA